MRIFNFFLLPNNDNNHLLISKVSMIIVVIRLIFILKKELMQLDHQFLIIIAQCVNEICKTINNLEDENGKLSMTNLWSNLCVFLEFISLSNWILCLSIFTWSFSDYILILRNYESFYTFVYALNVKINVMKLIKN